MIGNKSTFEVNLIAKTLQFIAKIFRIWHLRNYTLILDHEERTEHSL